MLTSGVAYKNTSLLQHSIFWGELSFTTRVFTISKQIWHLKYTAFFNLEDMN